MTALRNMRVSELSPEEKAIRRAQWRRANVRRWRKQAGEFVSAGLTTRGTPRKYPEAWHTGRRKQSPDCATGRGHHMWVNGHCWFCGKARNSK